MSNARKIRNGRDFSNEQTVELQISGTEARVLLAILRKVSGSPFGYRGHLDNIRRALEAAEVDPGVLEEKYFRTMHLDEIDSNSPWYLHKIDELEKKIRQGVIR